MSDQPQPSRLLRLRYAGTCRRCGRPLAAGEQASYYRASREIECLLCPSTQVEADKAEPEIEAGTAGASARREHQRRVAKREERIRAAHPKIGGLLLALGDDPQTTRSWQRGARGEELLAARLDRLGEQGVWLLHDRRIPGTRANIDHLAIGPAGVFVIDAKRYQGRPHLRVEGGLLRPRTETLLVGRRDCTKLVAGVVKQVNLVQTELVRAGFGGAPLRGMLCFVDGDWPLLGGDFYVGGVEVLWPKKANERIVDGADLSAEQMSAIHRCLGLAFPPA